MENALEKEVRLPADVRVLISAPISSQQDATKSVLLIMEKTTRGCSQKRCRQPPAG
jgi:hypothetical protein